MKNRWSAEERTVGDALDALVYQSRLLGAESSLVLPGTGSTSLKLVEVDFRGRQVDVLRIIGSGKDLRTVERRDVLGVRLDDLQLLFERTDLSDDEALTYLSHCLVEPTSRRPAIETLLHAFIPASSVVYTHPDVILALTSTVDHDALLGDLYGDRVLQVPNRRPGYRLYKEAGLAVRANPHARGLVLHNDGLVTWGETTEESYRKHVELVTEAEQFIASRVRRSRVFVAAAPYQLDAPTRIRVAARLAPVLRGALSRERRILARYTDTPEVLDFVGSPESRRYTASDMAAPYHPLNAEILPLWVEATDPADVDALAERFQQSLDQYRKAIPHHAERERPDGSVPDSTPRVVLVPGIGMWTVGSDPHDERLIREVFLKTIRTVATAESVSRFHSLARPDAADAGYTRTEQFELTPSLPTRELAGRVALVTGAASGIGRAIATLFAAAGAQVVVTDRDEEGARAVASAIEKEQGDGTAFGCRLDVTDEREVEAAFGLACLTYGGVDVLVSNAGIAHCAPIDAIELADWERSLAVNATGHFLVTRAALRLFKRQGIGGNIIFVATKNVVAPGRDFAAYSAAKAAEVQLARTAAIEGGPFGIRVNTINPDAILDGTRLWTPEILEGRARMYGISPDQLPDYYRKRNLLGVRITPDDVAQVALFLASERSAKITGYMINVDGGVRDAFPR